MSFEITEKFEFFHLHPEPGPACARCLNKTCKCPIGIDIPGKLKSLHAQMVDLRERGLIPLSTLEPIIGDENFGARVLLRDVPSLLASSERAACRIWVENTGKQGWFKESDSAVHLRVMADRHVVAKVLQRHDVQSGERAHFVFELASPLKASSFLLRLELIGRRLLLRRRQLVLHESIVEVIRCNGNTIQ